MGKKLSMFHFGQRVKFSQVRVVSGPRKKDTVRSSPCDHGPYKEATDLISHPTCKAILDILIPKDLQNLYLKDRTLYIPPKQSKQLSFQDSRDSFTSGFTTKRPMTLGII